MSRTAAVIPLSALTQSQLAALFHERDIEAASTLLEENCGDGLPLVKPEWIRLIDRIRAGVIRMSRGDLQRLTEAIRMANVDWRDVLVAAGFANDLEAHIKWSPRREW